VNPLLSARVDHTYKDLTLPSLNETTATDYTGRTITVSDLKVDSPLDDIVSVMLKDTIISRPTMLFFFTNQGENMKHCKSLFFELASTANFENSITLCNLYNSYKIEVTGSRRFEAINQNNAPLIVVVDTKKNIVGKVGRGNGKILSGRSAVTGKEVYSLLCKSASAMGVKDLKTIVRKQNAIMLKLCQLQSVIIKNKSLHRVAKTEGRINTLQKYIDRDEKAFNELLRDEKDLWQKAIDKVKSKAKDKA